MTKFDYIINIYVWHTSNRWIDRLSFFIFTMRMCFIVPFFRRNATSSLSGLTNSMEEGRKGLKINEHKMNRFFRAKTWNVPSGGVSMLLSSVNHLNVFHHIALSFEHIFTYRTLEGRHFSTFPSSMKTQAAIMRIGWTTFALESFGCQRHFICW